MNSLTIATRIDPHSSSGNLFFSMLSNEPTRTIFVRKFRLSSSNPSSDEVKSPPYSCSFCSKCFSSPSHLTRHTLTHTGEKPSLCSECGQQFSQISSLERHQRTKHRLDRQLLSRSFYQCHLCHEYFSLKHNLRMHERKLHHTPTNFFCQPCSAYFTCNSALQKHRNFRHLTSAPAEKSQPHDLLHLQANSLSDIWTPATHPPPASQSLSSPSTTHYSETFAHNTLPVGATGTIEDEISYHTQQQKVHYQILKCHEID